MANRKAKQGSESQSIVRHPLFPTIVAVWFAALFGLGSLAVRTSLLESLVIASKIDLIVTQTAPPLGITARIMIALVMAAIGSILGFVLALRLARPRPEIKQERVRTARGFGPSVNVTPASAHYPADDAQQDERGMEPERRRALIASNEGLGESAYHDDPGFIAGMPPHIFDVTASDVEPIDSDSTEPEPARHDDHALELDQYATVAPVPAQDEIEEHGNAVPASPRPFEVPAEPGHQRFDPPAAPAPAQPVAQDEAGVEEAPGDNAALHAFVAPVTSPLQFTVESPAGAEAPAPVPSDDVQSPVEPALSQEIHEAEADADDADPLAVFLNKVAPLPAFADEPGDALAPESAEIEVHGMIDGQPEPEPVSELASQPAADAAPAKWAPPLGAAAERLVNADLADLSSLELIERLALSLQRRGQAGATAPLAEAPHFEPLPVFAAEPQQAEAPVEIPAAEMPAATDEPEAAPSHLALPAALRPIDFAQYEQEDDLPLHVPARSIAMPSFEAKASVDYPATQPQPEPAAEADAPRPVVAHRFGRPAETQEPLAQTEEDVLEAGYSSLLDMSKPAGQRQQFVRVADPEAETDAAEPVVIFPGQAMRAGTRFAQPTQGPVVTPASPPPSLAETSSQPRRFDAPAAATRDPEETERALRSALATLQRMSGAA